MASSTSSFMFGTIVGIFTSFITKVKDMLRTFRSLFIQRDIVKFNPHILMHYFVKHGDIILLNKFRIDFTIYLVGIQINAICPPQHYIIIRG